MFHEVKIYCRHCKKYIESDLVDKKTKNLYQTCDDCWGELIEKEKKLRKFEGKNSNDN